MPKPSKPDIFMPFYIRDYVMDTLHLTLEEDCAYRRLLDVYWLSGARGLPDNDADLARMIRVDLPTWEKVRPRVITFFTSDAGILRNARADGVYLEACAAMEAASEHGKKGAAGRWKDKTAGNAQAEPEQSKVKVKVKSESPVQPPLQPKGEYPSKELPALTKAGEPGETWEDNLMRRCLDIFGAKEMGLNGGLWRLRAREDHDKLDRVLAELASMKKEGLPVHNLPAAATDLWKRFATKTKKK
jgi:uncharacterized protein YdaU (DUF1376 family)